MTPGLDRHVEGGDRLVEDDQLGLEGERSGDADALALPAGEVLRVAVGVARLEADELQQLVDALADRVLGEAVGAHRLGEDVEHRQPRVERRHRVLEHHLQVAADRLALRARLQLLGASCRARRSVPAAA